MSDKRSVRSPCCRAEISGRLEDKDTVLITSCTKCNKDLVHFDAKTGKLTGLCSVPLPWPVKLLEQALIYIFALLFAVFVYLTFAAMGDNNWFFAVFFGAWALMMNGAFVHALLCYRRENKLNVK